MRLKGRVYIDNDNIESHRYKLLLLFGYRFVVPFIVKRDTLLCFCLIFYFNLFICVVVYEMIVIMCKIP